MTSGRSKSRGFLLLVFIIKSISKKLLIKIFHSFKIKINLPKVKIEPILVNSADNPDGARDTMQGGRNGLAPPLC